MKFLVPIWANVAWFGCVYAAKWNLAPFSLMISLGSWAILRFQKKLSPSLISFLFAVTILGFAFDLLMIRSGLVLLSRSEFPWWLLALWLHFVTLLPLMANWLGSRLLLSALLGAVFGPLSYHSGESFGVLKMNITAIAIYAAFWGFLMPTTLRLLRRRFA